ncbi:uncharacterized protein LOC131327646 [Rhododendron vialii]|uniref:uncharacterized protein LOC131327646 n=1 Tax=Rhododendron vialii TaxID=182163 RepID=UPI00265D7016|nr:uncharacterized protein LOC131327646 [Rhododendron vialii]
MEAVLTLGVEKLEVIGDSNLVVSQANGDWKVREEKLKPYHQNLKELIPCFNKVTFTHIPRLKNQFADALATLASMVELPLCVKLRPIRIEQRDFPAYLYVNAIDDLRPLKRINSHYEDWLPNTSFVEGSCIGDPIVGCTNSVLMVLKP